MEQTWVKCAVLLVATTIWGGLAACHGFDRFSPNAETGASGGARLPNGSPCTDANRCDSGLCVDDVCCASRCDGSCVGCDTSGQCAAVAVGLSDTDCDGVCDAAGKCLSRGALLCHVTITSQDHNRATGVSAHDGVVAVTGYGYRNTSIRTPYADHSLMLDDNGVFALKLDGGCGLLRSAVIDGVGKQLGGGIAQLGDGLLLAGYNQGSLNLLSTTIAAAADHHDVFAMYLDDQGSLQNDAACAPYLSSPLCQLYLGVPMPFGMGSSDAEVQRLRYEPGFGWMLALNVSGEYDVGAGAVQTQSSDGVVVVRRDNQTRQVLAVAGAGEQRLRDVVRLSDGDLLIAGDVDGAFDVGTTAYADPTASDPLRRDIFFARLHSTYGSFDDWQVTAIPNATDDTMTRLAAMADGGYVATGTYQDGAFTLGGGSGQLVAKAYTHHFIARFDANGMALWARFVGYPANISDVAADGDGNIVVAGTLAGGFSSSWWSGALDVPSNNLFADLFVAKLSAGGDLTWLRVFTGAHTLDVDEIAIAEDSGVIAVVGRHLRPITVTHGYDGSGAAPVDTDDVAIGGPYNGAFFGFVLYLAP